MKRFLPYLIPILLLASITSLSRFFPDLIESSRLRVFDFYQTIQPRLYEPTPVRVVDLDDTTLEKYGQWPWPRTLMAELVSKLNASGVSVIAFDILFSEKDRTSPENMLNLWRKNYPSLVEEFKEQEWPDSDKLFAETLRQANIITAFTLTPKNNEVIPVTKASFGFSGEDPRAYMPNFPGAIQSLPELEAAAKGNGIIFYIPEFDGVVRRIRSIFQLNDNLYPSLVMETLRVYENTRNILIKTSTGSGIESYGEKTGIVNIKIGKKIIPTDKKGRLWLYDTGPIEERIIPVWKILEDKISSDELQNAIVLLGTSAAGLKDLRATPLDPGAPGVVVHAQLLEQILLGKYLNRVDWAEGAEFTFLVIVCLLLIFLIPKLGAAWSALLAFFAVFSSFYFSWNAFTKDHLLFDPLLPFFAILLIYITSAMIHFLKTDSEKRQIRGAFSRYLSPSVVEKLANNPDQLKLGGELKEMTFLFADIRDFTSISEQFNAHELTKFINQFLTPMTEIILKHQGTIDKYMGDCIMAFWNAPLDDEKHEEHACKAALEMQDYLLNANFEKKNGDSRDALKPITLQMGVGVNTGECCVGNMGSDQRFDYSVLGDAVNLASRLEGLSKQYGAKIVIGEQTREKSPHFKTLELDLVKVKGKSKPSRIYALMGLSEDQQEEAFAKIQQDFLTHYRSKNWTSAINLLNKLSETSLPSEFFDFKIYCQLFRERIETLKTHEPGADWDGAWQALSK